MVGWGAADWTSLPQDESECLPRHNPFSWNRSNEINMKKNKKLKGRENTKPASLTIGSLAFGGLLFCSLNEVDADIVASSVSNFVVNPNVAIAVDIDGDLEDDLMFFNNSATHLVQQASIYAQVRANGSFSSIGYQLRGFATGLGTYLISENNYSRRYTGLLAASSVAGPDWQGGSVTLNFAFDFRNAADETNYGWGTIEYNGVGNTAFTVTQLYYENEGNPIFVGDVGAVPEPSSTTLLALGAAGIGAYRRRRKAS